MAEGDELLDVLTEDGLLTGRSKRRAEVHRDGDWHRSFHLWIVKEGRYVLFQRRSSLKDLEPNKIDVTVGGHFAAGETLREVLREPLEELGLDLSPRDISYLSTRKAERFYEDKIDREFQEVYVMRDDRRLEDYGLNRAEVYALYEVPLARAIRLYQEGESVAAAGFDAYGRENNALLVTADLIGRAREDVAATLEEIQRWLES